MSNATGRLPFFQFSLGTALLMMAWVAMICVALTTTARIWLDVIGLVTLLALLVAVLAAVYCERAPRAFAVGFALFGFVFLFCLHRFDGYSPQLLARNWADGLFQITHKAEWGPIESALAARTTANQRLISDRARFVEIGQGVTIILAATLGGIFARYLYSRKRPRTDSP